MFTLLDGNGAVLREYFVDLQVCAPPTQGTSFISCHGNSHHLSNAACPTSNTQTRQRGIKHHRVQRLKKHYKWRLQQSQKFLMQQVQDDQIEDNLKTEGGEICNMVM